MSELNSIPQKQTVEIETVKLDETTLKTVANLNSSITNIVTRIGEIYIRRNELSNEFKKLDELQLQFDAEFKSKNDELVEFFDTMDEKYPQGRLNLQEGTIQYQPGAPTRKQIAEQQRQQMANGSNDMKVVN
jgi:hypothetical protein